MSKKILVIDDSETERLFISELIRKIEDVSCTEAASFAEAFAKLSGEKFDLILIDEYMPEGLGEKFWSSVREKNSGGNGATQAIIMGNESDFDEGYLKRNCFVNYLEKPIEFHMIKAAISLYT